MPRSSLIAERQTSMNINFVTKKTVFLLKRPSLRDFITKDKLITLAGGINGKVDAI